MAGNPTRRIAILTDSTCDLPKEVCQQHDIHVISQLIVWGSETLRADKDIDAETFYERLPRDPAHPVTYQPSVEDFAAAYTEISREAHEIVAILLSGGFSGATASAERARALVGVPVHVVDSLSISLGLGAIVMAAVQARDAGGDAAAIVAAARRRAARVRTVFVVDTLEYLHKGGRIGGAARWLGTALDLKPILHLKEGRLEPLERVRSREKALERLLELAVEGVETGARLGAGVVHAAAPEDAARIAGRVKTLCNPDEFMLNQATPVIGVHTGPGLVGIVTYNL